MSNLTDAARRLLDVLQGNHSGLELDDAVNSLAAEVRSVETAETSPIPANPLGPGKPVVGRRGGS